MLVSIKHAGVVHNDIELDETKPGIAFKQTIYEKTGVPVDRMKVMIKGGMLKDDTDWSKVGPKQGQVFSVIGTAGELPKPPEKPVVFMEDMDESQLAGVSDMPVGLVNLGNTCYLNSSIQVMRAIPELQPALASYSGAASGSTGQAQSALTSSLSHLYQGMSKTTEAYPPLAFLQALRTVNPQFAERSTTKGGTGMGMGMGMGAGYAQQDADECWGTIVNTMTQSGLNASQAGQKFTDLYMNGEMTTELRCDDAPDEPVTVNKEVITKLQCNISASTNFMHAGIMESLDQKIEKRSPSLDREAVYTQKSRISRLPSNLTVQMVRFYWRRDINKKAKIMRKVKFPFEFDVLQDGLLTDDLKQKMVPVNSKMKEIERDRQERRKVRRKMKAKKEADGDVVMGEPSGSAKLEATPVAGPLSPTSAMVDMPALEKPTAPLPGELEDENVIRTREAEELRALVHPDLKNDVGACVTGIYELCALVTHKGASADSGHYIGWVKRTAIDPPVAEDYTLPTDGNEEWYKFDDEKVSVVNRDKISSLDGGGEDSIAYILLYRSKKVD